LLVLVVVLLFGAKRFPEMGRSLGSGLRGFKQSINGEDGPADEAVTPGERRGESV
jgi:sec-independent protein translocase protein TatA